MGIYTGANGIASILRGNTEITKCYVGSNLVYDKSRSVSGNLPLVFDSEMDQRLYNYTVYGTSAGSGTPTTGSEEPNGYAISSM